MLAVLDKNYFLLDVKLLFPDSVLLDFVHSFSQAILYVYGHWSIFNGHRDRRHSNRHQ